MPEKIQTAPFIIMCAPNGAKRTHRDHPKLPISPVELANCAAEIRDAGASILHLHVRDENQQHSLHVDHYNRAIDAITDKVGDDLIIQVTTESIGRYSRFDQMKMVKDLKPEAVSLALRELVPKTADLDEISDFFGWLGENRVWPQIILYNKADYKRFRLMQKKGIFGGLPQFLLFVLNKPAEATPDFSLDTIAKFTAKVSDHWAACSFGTKEYNLADLCTRNGGHVRVGFENNIWRRDGSLAEDNAELVRNARDIARQNNRKIASAKEVRKHLCVRNMQQ